MILPDRPLVLDLQEDLARKYKTHGTKVEALWRSFDESQRTICLKAGAIDGIVLAHAQDERSFKGMVAFSPELNVRDVSGQPDFLLNLLRFRATTTIHHQFHHGIDDTPGDFAFIDELMVNRGLRLTQTFDESCHTFFTEDEYAMNLDLPAELAAGLAAHRSKNPTFRDCLPQATGELVLRRQASVLQILNVLVEDILAHAQRPKRTAERPKRLDKAAKAALSKLSLQAPAVKLELPDLVVNARSQQESLEEHLNFLSLEPEALFRRVNAWFFTRPELVPDEQGRKYSLNSDKYISAAVFDAVHGAIKDAAIWKYIERLLELLDTITEDRVRRAIVLQEISNICHLEYERTQSLFKRFVQRGTARGSFRRIADKYDKAGNPRVTMRTKPEAFTRSNPQLHYMLRLCQPETNAFKAIGWIKKLSELHEAHPRERGKMFEIEAYSLSNLAVIIVFFQDLSSSIPLPSPTRKKGQFFHCRQQELECELDPLRREIDLRDFAVPIRNLMEPGMAEGALRTLDAFFIQKTGTKIGFLYQDLVDDCLSNLETQYQRELAKLEQRQKGEKEPEPLPRTIPQPPQERVEQRREKEKTRPSHSSAYEIAPELKSPAEDDTTPPSQTFKVGSSTARVFSTLFKKSQARGSVHWAEFVAAMVELGFSVLPKFGSVYAFLPPDSLVVKKSLTLHRPHQSRIEGYLILMFAQRLKRVYGWGENTFETV